MQAASVKAGVVEVEKNFPFACFGLTKLRFEGLVALHVKLNETGTKKRASAEMPFYDWEAEKLMKIFDTHRKDEELCALVAAMMNFIQKDVSAR